MSIKTSLLYLEVSCCFSFNYSVSIYKTLKKVVLSANINVMFPLTFNKLRGKVSQYSKQFLFCIVRIGVYMQELAGCPFLCFA